MQCTSSVLTKNSLYYVNLFPQTSLLYNLQSLNRTKGPSLFDRLTPERVNWIVNYADWTQDSTCYTFTSCSCGIPARDDGGTDKYTR